MLNSTISSTATASNCHRHCAPYENDVCDELLTLFTPGGVNEDLCDDRWCAVGWMDRFVGYETCKVLMNMTFYRILLFWWNRAGDITPTMRMNKIYVDVMLASSTHGLENVVISLCIQSVTATHAIT